MIPRPPYPEHPPEQNCPADLDDLCADIDRLHARVDDAERRIDEALTPEPVDWQAHYREVFATVDAEARRLGTRFMDGEG